VVTTHAVTGTESPGTVVVAGGGPAGIAAAIAAARTGASVVLIERYGFLGGMVSAGLVTKMHFTSLDGVPVVRGLFSELVERLAKEGGSVGDHIDPELVKYVAMTMMLENNVRQILHSTVVDVLTDNDRITGLVLASPAGLQTLRGAYFIDATGNGDVAAKAGALCEKGRASDGKMQAVTLRFRIGNVDLPRFVRYIRDHPEYFPEECPTGTPTPLDELEGRVATKRDVLIIGDFSEAYKPLLESLPHLPVLSPFVASSLGTDILNLNSTRVADIDATNVEDLTRAEIVSRQQAHALFCFLKEYIPGFESACFLDTATQVGVRETRRIVGHYVLSEQDVLEGTRFPDVVAKGKAPIDIHNPLGKGSRYHVLPTSSSYQIPYRSLIPKHIANLLAAGRCISCDHVAHSSIRYVNVCMGTGHAAGVAAGLLAREGKAAHQLDVPLLQAVLVEQGANIS
jgi:hypothetical protein